MAIKFHLLGTADHFKDRHMMFSHQTHGVDSNHETEAKALKAAQAFMASERDLGDNARCWIEKERWGKRGKIRSEVVASFVKGDTSGPMPWIRNK